MTKNELKKLKSLLPNVMTNHEINKVLVKNGGKEYSDMTIKLVLNGTRQNDAIILAAVEVANQHQAKLKEARESIKKQ